MKPVLLTVIIFKLRYLLVPLLLLSLTACSGVLFFPGKNWVRTPEQLGIEYRDVELIAEDGVKLSAWWLEPRGEVKGTILFLHGNAENISTHLGSVYWLPELGYQVLLLDYRGYGHSEGAPSLPAVFSDIKAAFDWMLVQPEVQDKPVYLLGQSLGASMGGYVVATTPSYSKQLDAVVLDAGFASYSEIAREVASRHWLTWAFQYPAGWSMPGAYDLLDHVDGISPTPVLIIHGTEDAVVPFSQGERIFDAAKRPKSFLSYDGPHIGTFRDLENRDLMLKFLEQAPARKAGAEAKLKDSSEQ